MKKLLSMSIRKTSQPPIMDKEEGGTKEIKMDEIDAPRAFQLLIQKDIALSELNDRLNRQVTQLKILQSVADKTRMQTDVKEVLDVIAKSLVVELQFFSCVIFWGQPSLNIAAFYSYSKINSQAVGRDFVIKNVYETDKPHLIINRNSANEAEQALAELVHLTSLYILPLRIRAKERGVLIAGLNDPYQQLSKGDREFLEIVANFTSNTIEGLQIEERQNAIDALKSEFVSIASHQLRTPLSVIKWILKLFIDGDLGVVSSEQKEFLEKAYASNQRMINLVNDLLDVSRIEEGRFGYRFTTFDFIVLLKEILDGYKVLVTKNGVELAIDIESAGAVTIHGDRERLSLVFNNLIDNAVKFTPRKGHIRIMLSKERGKVIIRISDTGIGVSEADKERLFNKFFRAENARQMQTEGTGLGLFIAKNIIEKHRGTIHVDSTLGKGTVVTCVFPSP